MHMGATTAYYRKAPEGWEAARSRLKRAWGMSLDISGGLPQKGVEYG